MGCVCTSLHVPFRWGIASPPPSSSLCCYSHSVSNSMPTSARIAIVGDVHDDWNLEEDANALQLLKPDLVLFTGDFGNENVDLVRSISELDCPKAVILGNHDAWNTHTFSARDKDAVQLQLEYLGDVHIGYQRMDIPNLKLSVVGGRPFSCGDQQLFRKKLLVSRYNVRDMNSSAKRIYEAASKTPPDHSIVFLAHNGPTGLGSNMDDICGRDWVPGGGDHGDPDLAHALSQLKEIKKLPIQLVVFGHMHKGLAYGGGLRKMIVVGDDGTIYLNGAIVPRVKKLSNEQVNVKTADMGSVPRGTTTTLRAFTVADILDGTIQKIVETWVSVNQDEVKIEDEIMLFEKPSSSL